jgi:Carboxypeptidase regulatory-like domain
VLKIIMNVRNIVFAMGLVILLSSNLGAQTFRGGIGGSVTDSSGAIVPNIDVTATADETGLVHRTTSSGAGEFLFQDLPLGTYSVRANATGFQPEVVRGVTVNGGTIYSLVLKLSVSSLTTSVEVSASALALDTASSVQTTVVAGKSLQDLPLDSRDFKKIVGVVPGFAGYSGVLGSVNGARSNQTNWQIDGTDNNDLWANNSAINQSGIGGIAGTLMPIDAIDQFSLQTQSSPETGRNPGATANLIIKSGTNQLHGSVYYFNRNEALAASPVFVPKRELRNENYGFSFGGPIIRNKTFFFTAFEKQQFTIALSGLATEPSVAYQAQAQSLLAANNIPVNPVSTNLLNTLWPASALTGPASSGNFISPDPETGYSYNGVAKVDHTFNERNTISARWVIGQGNQIAPVGSNLKYYYEVAPIHVQNYSIVYNRVISSRLVNQLLLGVSSYNQVFHDFNTSFDVDALGLNTNSPFTGAPNITISGFDPTGETPPEGRNDVTGHITDALSYNVGAHQLRFGGEYRKAQLDEFYFRNSLGAFTFDGSQGSYTNNPNDYGSTVEALADFMAGRVSTSSLARGNAERLVYVNTFDLFAQDAWQLTRRLNVNYGLRYDYVGPMHNGDKNLPTFLPNNDGLVVQGVGTANLYPQDWNNIAPRAGFSFQPKENGTLVVRGGFGVYFDSSSLSPFLDNRPGNGGPNGFEGNPAGANPVQTITQNAYTIQSGQPLFVSNPATLVGLFSVDPNFHTPYSYNYNISVQQSLSSKTILQISYVGSESRKQITLRDINQAGLNPASPGNPAVGILGGKPGSIQQNSRPFFAQFPNYSVINQVESNGTSNYNSLQATLRTSSWHGLSSQFNYTWSHSLDDMTQYRSKLPQDSNNLKADYGNSDYDTRNNFNAALVYALPRLGRGPAWATEGWQLNGAVQYRGGLPYNIVTSTDTTGTGEKYQRPNLVGNPYAGVTHSISGTSQIQWINPAAFAAPTTGTFGNLRRNQLYGPGYGDLDLSIFKNTRIAERFTLQLRAEMFNLYNRNNYSSPGATFGSSSFGKVSDTIGDANGSPGIGPGEPFNTQIAIKVLF